jgi:hypothetical protein
MELTRGVTTGRFSYWRGLRTEEEEGRRGLAGRAHMSAREKRNKGYRFGFLHGLRAASPYWAEGFPEALFHIFLSFLLFLFLFS